MLEGVKPSSQSLQVGPTGSQGIPGPAGSSGTRYYAHDPDGAETTWTLPTPPVGSRQVTIWVHARAADPAVGCAVVMNAGTVICASPSELEGGGDAWGEMTFLDWPTSTGSVGHAWDQATGTVQHVSNTLVAPIDNAHPIILTSVDKDTLVIPVPLPIGSRIEAWAQ